MKKYLISILFLLIGFVGFSQTYDPTKATVSNKPYGMAQAFPTDARSFFYDATNFLWRPYQNTTEVKTYLNLAKYRAGNFLIIVDSGGTLSGNGTYTGGVNNLWMFKDGVLDANLIELNLQGGASGCPTCFFTTTQLSDSAFKLNRPNGTSDTVVVDFITGVYISTLNNGLNLVGTNGQLGGPLVKNTVLNGGGFDFAVSGNTFQQGQGAAIASANVMTTGHDGNSFPVIGSTQINAITTTNWQAGSIISFTFTGTPLLRNNQVAPAGSAPLLLAGGVDYTAATNDVIFFLYDGTLNVWHETSRKLAGSVIAVTANNGVSLLGSLLQWGGTLVKPTTVAGNLFPTFFSGGRVEMPMGLPILAAGDLIPGNDGIFFHITGTTQINAITTTNYQAGAEIAFVFDGIVTVKNNTVGGVNTAPMLLAGRVDYTSAVGDYIAFQYDGVNWYETNRKLSGSVTSSVTLNNGLTLTGINGQLGGTLVKNTVVTGGTFNMNFTSTAANTLTVNNTGVGVGISASSSNSDAVQGTGANGGNGGTFSTDFGSGIQANATGGGTPFTGVTTPQTTSSVDNAFAYFRLASGGTSVVGEGLLGAWILPNSIGGNLTAVRETVTATNVVNATFSSKYAIGGYLNGTAGVPWMEAAGTGITSFGTVNGFVSTGGSGGAVLTGTTIGVLATSPTVAIQGNSTSTTNNASSTVLQLSRQGVYVGAAGVGGKIVWDMENNSPADINTGEISNQLTNPTAGSETSQFDFNVKKAGSSLVTHFSIGGFSTFTSATRLEESQGAIVASANNLTLGTDGNAFHISGTTTINAITVANWQAGSVITLIFDGSLTVKNNTAGGAGTAVMHLLGAADYTAAANGVLTILYDGAAFYEKSRSVN